MDANITINQSMLQNMKLPNKSTFIKGKTGTGKTQLFKKLLSQNGTPLQTDIETQYNDLNGRRIIYLTEESLILSLKNLELYSRLKRHLSTANYILFDEIFNKLNWEDIKETPYVILRYYALFDYWYSNREIIVIANSNHTLSEVYPEAEDSFLRRVNEVFTDFIEVK